MAAQGPYIERLARASTQVKIAILVGVLAVAGGLYYYFFYADLVADRDQLVSVRKRQIEDEQRLIKRQSAYRELLKQKADVEDRLKRNAVKLPESSELPALFRHLESQAASANVFIRGSAPDKEVPVETYIKVPVKMEISGDFYQINNFFKLLAETTRIITIENLSIGEPHRDGATVRLTAKFTASTFRQADKTPATPGAKAPPGAATPPPPAPTPPPPAPTPPPAAPPAPASAPAAASRPTPPPPPAAPAAEGKK